jgi:hypothetical protein
MKKDEFYIGWKDERPTWFSRFSLIVISALSGLTVLLVVLWISASSDFVDSNFDYGNQTIHKGIIQEYPAPMLVVMEDSTIKTYPLVNFGKFGAEKPIEFFNSQMRNNLLNYRVELRGTVIEFDGKTWLELTDENYSLLSFEKLDTPSPPLEVIRMGRQEITGEIVDPKCFFGVMKPGFGKVHLSCAVRCISGGVPPILVAPHEDGSRSYYFVTGRDGKTINDDIVSYVGFPVTVSGVIKSVEDWNVLEMDTEGIKLASLNNSQSIFSVCETADDQRLTNTQE